jgi:LCP family protein required for cell wall assembly
MASPARSGSSKNAGRRPPPPGQGSQRGGGQPPGRPRKRSLRAKILGWGSVVLVAALVGATLTVYLKTRSVWDSIHHLAVTDLGKRPPKYTNALNVLVFGSDRRSGLTPHQQFVLHVGRNTGENNTDTIMVVHISPGRHAATVLSIPRDTMVRQYACDATRNHPGQHANPAGFVQVNSLFAIGGVSCLWKTVEHETGIRLDHFIELSFTGFVNVVNDLGGVNVCLPFPVTDYNSGLHLTRGEHHIKGVTALQFWRTRYAIGMGTDLQRIQRDQYLLAQVLRGVLHSRLLTTPTRLLSVVRDAAKAMTTDNSMTQADLLQIAASLRGLSDRSVQFITAPNTPYPPSPSQVEFAQPHAGRVFRAIAHDVKLPGKPGTGSGKAGAAASPGANPSPAVSPDARPSQVKVQVLNGSGITGLAGQAAAALTSRGFQVTGTGDAPSYGYTGSVIKYASPTGRPAVNTLRKQLSDVTVQQDTTLAPGTIELILGSSFSQLAQPSSTAASPKATQSVHSLAGSYGGITGDTACKGDRAAFKGPNSP